MFSKVLKFKYENNNLTQFYFSDPLNHKMELLKPMSDLSVDEEPTKAARSKKKLNLSHYLPRTRQFVFYTIDELVCRIIFQFHMQLKLGIEDPNGYRSRSISPIEDTFIHLYDELNVVKVNQDVDCPKCGILVKCQSLSKHLAVCMNPHQSTYSYSSRNSSRIARQRIQEGFKTSYDEAKNDSDDERVKPKRRTKARKKN